MTGERHKSIHEWFAWQAARRPDAVAVVDEHDQLTYGELDERANQLAHHLSELGVGPAMPVGVHLPRTAQVVVAVLAVLKAGGAYLPLDPANPAERLEFMLADAGVEALLTDSAMLSARHVVRLDQIDLTGYPATVPTGPGAGVDALAYVIYTSGSTGTPKGVMVEHRNVLALLTGTRGRFAFDEHDVWTMCASIAFDVSVWEMWGALLHGGRLVVVSDQVRRSPEELHALLRRERVTVLNQTPAAFRGLIRADEVRDPDETDLRLVIFAGESLTAAMLAPWLARHGEDRPVLVNMYGITETTVHSTYRRMRQADVDTGAGSLIGEALDGWTVRVLDEHGRECAVGQPGELYVGGAGVTRGYLGRPELTEQRYLPDPLAPGSRIYRSGDRARRLADGDIEYLGRLDNQVKIRGHRIELGEIEVALGRHPGVREGTVLALPDQAGDLRLVAYWVGAGASMPTLTDLRAHLGASLPEYMVPSVFIALPALPLTGNGKVDWRALPEPDTVRPELAVAFAEPQSPLQVELAKIWAEVLDVDRVGLDDDFFELGGQSMLAAEVVALTRERLGRPASLRLLFDESTLRAFAAALEENAA